MIKARREVSDHRRKEKSDKGNAAMVTPPLLDRLLDEIPKSNAIAKIKEIVAGRMIRGLTFEQVIEDLNETEREVMSVYELAEKCITLREAAEKMGKPDGTISSSVTSIRHKLAGGYDPDVNKCTRKSKKAQRIRKMVEERLEKGETLDQMYARLNENEKGVLSYYVLGDAGFTQWEVAQILDIARTTVAGALTRIEKKIRKCGIQVQMPFM